MEQTETISSERPTIEVESERDPHVENVLRIPDGGWGWFVCFAGFMTNFTTVGMISTNGVLLLALIDLYGETVSKTAMVGSIFMGVINCVGPFVLFLMMFNASHRQVIIFGGVFSAVTTFANFFVQKLEVLYVTYGILSERKSKSAPVLQTETNLGFELDENTTENDGETSTNNSDSRVHHGHSENGPPTNMTSTCSSKCTYIRKIVFDPDVMKNHSMQLLLIIYFLWAAAEITVIYLPAKCVDVGLNREQGALIISIYGAVLTFSQICVGLLADLFHIPKSYLLMSSLLGMSAITVAITFCQSFYLFALCTSVLSMCHGFSFTLRLVLVASILGVENLDKGYSPLCLLTGLAYIIDTIITGSMFDATQSFDAVFYFIAGCLFVASIVSSGIIYIQRKGKFRE